MKKFTKWSSVALATVVVSSLLTACSGESSDKKAKTSTSEDGRTVIKVVRPVQELSSSNSEQVKKVQDKINERLKKIGADVYIEYAEYPSGEYTNKTNLALANGEIDLFWTASWMGAVSTDAMVKANGVYDISKLLPDTKLGDSMPKEVWDASSYNGKNYFIPVYKEIAEGYDLMFRQDLVKKHNWDLSKVTALKDIEPMLADAKKDGIKAPLFTQATPFGYKFLLNDFAWILGSYVGVDRETGEIVDVTKTDNYVTYVKLMADWADKGYIQEGDLTNTNPSDALQSDFWGISWWTDVPDNTNASTRYKQAVETVHMTGNFVDSNTTLGSVYAISSTSTETEAKAAVEFLGDLYTDKEIADLFTYGIEGEDYTIQDGYVVANSDKFKHSAWESTSFKAPSLQKGEPENKVELYDTFNADIKKSLTSGFRYDATETEALVSAVRAVVDKYAGPLENGGYKPKEIEKALKEYYQALDEAGYQDLLKDVQKQYADWKAKQ
ncbi:hypothetical protein BU202_02370 [Streptococcus cuniculi]|uniref:DUF3502 domain-containing protein n=1 Tax=Streptococcus cuniculi TaxID=1432788 RepID=A0A1Q8E9L6_9STRE|nr:ABC transporter substrate-binding protein [Streptococcus cuniculi]OLF48481.1 hypothetical protein BU202_02370 [Streptococcus cuniculi]